MKPHELAGYQDALTKERVSWGHVKQYSTFICTALVRKYGIREGDTISLFSQNTIWYPVAMFSVLRAGGRVSGASPAYTVDEMTYALKMGQTKLFMTTPDNLKVALEAADNAGISRDRIILLEGEEEGFTTLHDLIEFGRGIGRNQVPAYKIPRKKSNKDICGFLSFSSGTTGLPKAVCFSKSVALESLELTMARS
jgi:4-coumarate--CoA ligase